MLVRKGKNWVESETYVNDAGTWRKVQEFVRVAGVWRTTKKDSTPIALTGRRVFGNVNLNTDGGIFSDKNVYLRWRNRRIREWVTTDMSIIYQSTSRYIPSGYSLNKANLSAVTQKLPAGRFLSRQLKLFANQ